MVQNIIYYTVISLTKDQADEVLCHLKKELIEKQAMKKEKEEKKEDTKNILEDIKVIGSLVHWLENKKDIIYGDLPDDWKPFGNNKITDIVEQGTDRYKSDMKLIPLLNEECTNIRILKRVQVFFIDIFAMYTYKYKMLATRLDFSCYNSRLRNCCFLINYELPFEGQNHLEKIFQEFWPSVSDEYKEGCLHRVVLRTEDLENFKNQLKNHLPTLDIPHPLAFDSVGSFLGNDKTIPKLGGDE